MATASLNTEQLQSAFELFNQHSGRLEQSYRELQQRVERLTGQLRQTQSKRLEELVAKEKLGQHLAHLLDTLPGAILVLDGDGIIIERNSAAMQLLKQPLCGCSWATIVHREARAGGSEDGNIELKDGRWLSLSRRPLKQEPGEVLLLADITEARQMSALRQRQERLRTIGEMTAKFAHDVRTPLASAMLYAGQLNAADQHQQRIVQKITARLNDLGRMVNDMLGFAAGARRTPDRLTVEDLFADIALSIEPHLDATTDFRIDNASGALTLAGNRDALKGAVLNLVCNAIQACRGGGSVTLSAAATDGWVEFVVTDSGTGISDEVLPRLFEPFFTTRPQGTGLGLAVVQAVAAAHDGEVLVESSPGGSRFMLRVPALGTTDGAGDDD